MNQPLPSGDTEADQVARVLARLRGPEIRPADGTLIAEDLRVQGQVVADARATVRRAVAQAHPGTATDLLGELEEEYGLPTGGLSVAERQLRLLAKVRAHGDGSMPAVVRTVRAVVPIATLLAIAASDVADTDPDTAVFNLVILVSLATLDDTRLLKQIDALLAEQLTAHCGWTYGRGDGPDILPFLCDRRDRGACDIDLLAS